MTSALRQLYSAAMKSRTVRDAVYERWNADGFTDLAQHELMLADRVRVDTYHEAIARNIGGDDIVVDLGTGTGILAMYAARRAKRVYAIDHSPFIDVAKRIARHNGFDNIVFVQEHSQTFSPPEHVDVVIHEQMGDELINENLLGNLLDLKRRILKPRGRILPGRFELYVEPVMLREDARIPYLWELDLHGVRFDLLEADPSLDPYKRRRYHQHRLPPKAVARFLGEPAPLLAFDLDDLTEGDELPTSAEVIRTVDRGGTLDGFCVHFRALFDENKILTTSPLAPQTHWRNRLFRVPRRDLEPGELIAYRVDHAETLRPASWSLTLLPAPSASLLG